MLIYVFVGYFILIAKESNYKTDYSNYKEGYGIGLSTKLDNGIIYRIIRNSFYFDISGFYFSKIEGDSLPTYFNLTLSYKKRFSNNLYLGLVSGIKLYKTGDIFVYRKEDTYHYYAGFVVSYNIKITRNFMFNYDIVSTIYKEEDYNYKGFQTFRIGLIFLR